MSKPGDWDENATGKQSVDRGPADAEGLGGFVDGVGESFNWTGFWRGEWRLRSHERRRVEGR